VDVKAYIESGVLELYVMGALTPQEAAEVERYAALHPEIRAEIDELQQATSEYLESLLTPPPAHLKEKVLRAATGNISQNVRRPAKKVQLPASRSPWPKYIAVAASLALAVSLLLNFIQYGSNRNLYKTVARQQAQIDNLNKDYEKVYTAYYKLEDKMLMMASPENKMVHLKGVKNSDIATIIWNPASSEVYLSVDKLIDPPSGKQYQLWAIVNNKPVDLGVFEAEMKSYEMLKMKNVVNASAFAVTVEKEGGSPVPTTEAMWLLGSV